MSTKRDLVEAHAFSRRRLVTAFVSGAPGGREVEPVRPGRTIIGGLALAVLMVAGAAVVGVLSPRTPPDWREAGIVIAKESGRNYVVLEDDGSLIPTDPVSARLIFGDAEPKSVSIDEISKVDIGEDIGIVGAPASVPPTSLLVDSGWSACINDQGGEQIRIDRDPAVTAQSGAGLLVTEGSGDGAATWLLAASEVDGGMRRYEIPQQRDVASLSNFLGFGEPLQVGTAWLNLFPEGRELSADSFPTQPGGTVPAYADQIAAEGTLEVGDLVLLNGRHYLLGDDEVYALPDFAAEFYKTLHNVDAIDATDIEVGSSPIDGIRDWPATEPVEVDGEQPCAVLDAEAGEPARTLIGGVEEDSPAAAGSDDSLRVSVGPGQGAYVRTAGFGDSSGGQPWMIDASGKRFPFGSTEDAGKLGYGSYDVPTVPDAWIEGLEPGPELSAAAAREPISTGSRK